MDRYAFVVLYKVALKFHRSWVNDLFKVAVIRLFVLLLLLFFNRKGTVQAEH